MKGDKILKSQFFRHGTKFVVTDQSEDTMYGPGTTGYISHVKGFDQDFPNVAYLVVAIIRRGKNGKPRLEKAEISTPIFDLPDEALKEKMPDEKRRYYVHIEPVEQTCEITELADIDFLGWMFSISLYVNKLGSRARHFKPWPKGHEHSLNVGLLANEIWSESEEHAVETVGDVAFRQGFTRAVRLMESTLVKPSLGYFAKLAGLEVSAIQYIMNNVEKGKIKTPLKTLGKTMEKSGKKKDEFEKFSTALNPIKKSK